MPPLPPATTPPLRPRCPSPRRSQLPAFDLPWRGASQRHLQATSISRALRERSALAQPVPSSAADRADHEHRTAPHPPPPGMARRHRDERRDLPRRPRTAVGARERGRGPCPRRAGHLLGAGHEQLRHRHQSRRHHALRRHDELVLAVVLLELLRHPDHARVMTTTLTRRFGTMGGQGSIHLESATAGPGRLDDLACAVQALFADVEATLSPYLARSELSALNRDGRPAVPASPLLADLARAARRASA